MKTLKINNKYILIFLLCLMVTSFGFCLLYNYHKKKDNKLKTNTNIKIQNIQIKKNLPKPSILKNIFATNDRPQQQPLIVYPLPNITKMKKQGCIADGLLSGYGRTSKDIKVAKESNCYFFSRAIETWLEAPNFRQAVEIKKKINKPNALYGMFIAEAINKKEKYIYYNEGRRFDFSKMCKKGSKNFWGEHTCKPSFAKDEYRKYLKQITETAMDIGIQVFLFGQIYHQEENLSSPVAPEIIKEMRKYAKKKNMKIIIGAQTNNISDEKYLKLFDFIEGGVGLHPDGTIESNPCFSHWYNNTTNQGWCWALLWNKPWKEKANNVFIHLDWSGIKGDDMSTLTLMPTNIRHQTLIKLHQKFTGENIGFLLPLLTPLPKNNKGCHGPRKRFYSPSMKYGCKDLDTINKILKQK